MAFTDSGDNAPPSGGAPPDAGPQGGGGPPPGGGPILAALAARRGPQTSAPGMGNQAQGLVKLKMAAEACQEALPDLPVGTPLHTACLNALRQLSRHLQQAPMGTQTTQLQDMLRSNMRNQLMSQIMQSQQGQGGAGGPPGAGGGGPPMPSTPLPGA